MTHFFMSNKNRFFAIKISLFFLGKSALNLFRSERMKCTLYLVFSYGACAAYDDPWPL